MNLNDYMIHLPVGEEVEIYDVACPNGDEIEICGVACPNSCTLFGDPRFYLGDCGNESRIWAKLTKAIKIVDFSNGSVIVNISEMVQSCLKKYLPTENLTVDILTSRIITLMSSAPIDDWATDFIDALDQGFRTEFPLPCEPKKISQLTLLEYFADVFEKAESAE